MIKNYPVSTKKCSKEEAPFIYTDYAEDFARKRNLEPRTAGTIACFAGEPLQEGMMSKAWEDAGFVTRR